LSGRPGWEARDDQPADPGALASGGIAVLVYGLGRVATGGAGQSALGLAACVAGLALVASLGIHA